MKINKNVIIASVALLSFAACKPEMTAPTDAQIDEKVAEIVDARKAEMLAQCDQSLLEAANLEADKVLVASANKPARVVAAPAPAPKPAAKKRVVNKKKVTPKKVVKKPTKPSNTNRPGSTQGAGKASNTSRPGANSAGQNKNNGASNTSRPGATNSNRPGANK